MLSSVSSIQTQTGLTDAFSTAFFAQVLPQVDRMIKTYCQDEIEAPAGNTPYTEYYGGYGTDRLILRHRPVTSIVNIWLDMQGYYGSPSGSFDSTTLLVAGQDYCLVPDMPDGVSSKMGVVQRIDGYWPPSLTYIRGLVTVPITPSRGTIKVVYNAGYSNTTIPIPYDLQAACNQGVMTFYQMRNGNRLSSEGFEGVSYAVMTPKEAYDVLNGMKEVLNHYKRWRVGV